MTDEHPEPESPEREEPESPPRRYIVTSLGGFLELPPPPAIDYEELRRRAREASPEERIEAATAYLRSRYEAVLEPYRVFKPWLPYRLWDEAVREEPGDEP